MNASDIFNTESKVMSVLYLCATSLDYYCMIQTVTWTGRVGGVLISGAGPIEDAAVKLLSLSSW